LPGSFALDQLSSTIVCEAAYTKNGRKAEQPIPAPLAEALRLWVPTRPVGCPVFSLPEKTAEMLRVDLETTGIDHETWAGVIDFHSLRTTCASALVSFGASVKKCQTQARYSTPSLTIGTYAKAGLHDIAGAVEGLPDLATPRPATEADLATGTHGRVSKRFSPPLPLEGDGYGRNLSDSGVNALPDVLAMKREKPLDFSAPDGHSGVLSAPDVIDVTSSPGGGMADAGDSKSPGTFHLTSDRTTSYPSISDRLSHPLPTGAPETPPDLALVVVAWPTLPEPIRAGILAMVKAASGKGGG